MNPVWQPDPLGPAFQQTTVETPHPDGGETAPWPATLVRSLTHPRGRAFGALRGTAVLYVHGWSDYFFQTDVAEFFRHRGADFYALDLPAYGRSIRPGQTPGYTPSLRAYDAVIDEAVSLIESGPRFRSLVLVGHSTGGLVLSLWAARRPGRASAVVLNSPWLELQLGGAGRDVISPFVAARAKVAPLGQHPVVDLGIYTRAQREIGSLPDAPPGWRPENGFPTHPGWLAAVIEGHREVASGIEVAAPALVLLSARSASPWRWTEAATAADTVLVVKDIADRATRIARELTIVRVDGAVHDVFLSRAEPRATAFTALERWLGFALDRPS